MYIFLGINPMEIFIWNFSVGSNSLFYVFAVCTFSVSVTVRNGLKSLIIFLDLYF
jgi:hypothetical protein